MQYVSKNVRALLARYAKITLAVYIDGSKTEAGVGACQLSASCGGADAFYFGNACASSVELSLAASIPEIKGKELLVTWAVDETENPLFVGKVYDAVVQAGRTSIEAWDAMYYGGSDAFVPSYEMLRDIDAFQAFSGIASAMGVSANPDVRDLLEGIIIKGGMGHLPEDTSNSAAAGYIAGLIGGNAMINRAGFLTVRKITQTDFETEPYAGGASAQGKDFYITGITLQREEIGVIKNEDGTTAEQERVSEFYAGDGTLMVNNPLADQNAAGRAYEALKSVVYRPGSYTFPGGLLLEPGDLFAVNSMDGKYTVAAVMLSMSFDGGVKTTVSCGGYAPEGGAQGAINQALATLYADFARLRTLVAENAQIVSARITNLTVDDIAAGRIRSTDFAVTELQEIYPGGNVYPASTIFPNNGEEIIRGFEIDFSSGVIRGVFWSEPVAALEARCLELENQISYLELDVDNLDGENAELQQQVGILEDNYSAISSELGEASEQITDLQTVAQELSERLARLENSLLYPISA